MTDREIFDSFIGNDIYDLASKKDLEPYYDKKSLTLMEVDVKAFTSEKGQFTSDDLVKLLNTYFKGVSQIVGDREGIIEQFVGDSIFSIFGLKDDSKDSANACLAALDCLRFAEDLENPIDLSIGIHKGLTIYGFFGSPEKLSFMTIGDSRNLVSKFKNENENYGTNIIVSEPVRKCLADDFQSRLLDPVAVKGKREPMNIYELINS